MSKLIGREITFHLHSGVNKVLYKGIVFDSVIVDVSSVPITKYVVQTKEFMDVNKNWVNFFDKIKLVLPHQIEEIHKIKIS